MHTLLVRHKLRPSVGRGIDVNALKRANSGVNSLREADNLASNLLGSNEVSKYRKRTDCEGALSVPNEELELDSTHIVSYIVEIKFEN